MKHYIGHIKNGQIVFETPVNFPDGTLVRVFIEQVNIESEKSISLRHTQYEYDDPFEPACDPNEWEANR